MKLNITWKHARIGVEAFVLIKYGVISDFIKWVRHVANIAGESVNAVTNGVNDISGQITRTVDAVNYQTDTVAANITNADKSVLQMAICVIITFALLYRFGPVLYAMWVDSVRGDKQASRGNKKASSGNKKASSGNKKASSGNKKASSGKEARFNKWVVQYGGDFKTKKEAKAAFDAFEKYMGY